jgi:hypothetical protein
MSGQACQQGVRTGKGLNEETICFPAGIIGHALRMSGDVIVRDPITVGTIAERGGFSTSGRVSRQSNRAQIVQLPPEPSPPSFRQVHEVCCQILIDLLGMF